MRATQELKHKPARLVIEETNLKNEIIPTPLGSILQLCDSQSQRAAKNNCVVRMCGVGSGFGRNHCRPLARREESHWFISSSGFPRCWEERFMLLLSLRSCCPQHNRGALLSVSTPFARLFIQRMMKRSQTDPPSSSSPSHPPHLKC